MSEIRVETNPFESPTSVAPSENRSKPGNNSLIVLYVLAATIGGVGAFAYPTLNTLFSLLLAFAVTNWAVVDTRIRGGRFSGILRVVYFFFWPLASLVYLIATRKLRGFAWWGLNAVGLFTMAMIANFGTLSVLYALGRTDLIDPFYFADSPDI